MQMISTIVSRQQPIGLTRIAYYTVEIDDAVKVPRRSNPLIHSLAIGFTGETGMIVVRSDVRGDRRTDYPDAMRMGAFNDLLIRSNHLLHASRMLSLAHFPVALQRAEIVHSFENNQPARSRWRQHITIETRQRVRAQAVGQEMISADALVHHSDVTRLLRTLQAGGQHVGPAVISVRRGSVSICDRVAEHHHRSGPPFSQHVDFRYLVPVVHAF